jgi:hypothetical protein
MIKIGATQQLTIFERNLAEQCPTEQYDRKKSIN